MNNATAMHSVKNKNVTPPGELGTHPSNYIGELAPTAKAVKKERIKNNHRRWEEIFDSITTQVKVFIDNFLLILLCFLAIAWACIEFGHQFICGKLVYMIIGAIIGPVITNSIKK